MTDQKVGRVYAPDAPTTYRCDLCSKRLVMRDHGSDGIEMVRLCQCVPVVPQCQ